MTGVQTCALPICFPVTIEGVSRYDFQFKNLRGYKTTIEGLSHKFKPEFWNYAKLISGTLRHGMPIENVVELINRLELDSESINTWKAGVVRALKRYFLMEPKLTDISVATVVLTKSFIKKVA